MSRHACCSISTPTRRKFAPGTLAGQALRELGVDLDELPSMIERIRAQALPTEEDRIEEVLQEIRTRLGISGPTDAP